MMNIHKWPVYPHNYDDFLYLTCADVWEALVAIRCLGRAHNPLIEKADSTVVTNLTHPVEPTGGIRGDLEGWDEHEMKM